MLLCSWTCLLVYEGHVMRLRSRSAPAAAADAAGFSGLNRQMRLPMPV